MPNDEGYDIKLERAVKAIDVMKKLGEVFGGTKKIISEPIYEDTTLMNSIFFIERQIREIVPAQELILKKLDILLERIKK